MWFNLNNLHFNTRRRKTQKSRRTSDVVQNKMIEEDNMTIVDSRMPERLPPSTDKLITKHTLEANNGKLILKMWYINFVEKITAIINFS